MNITKSKRLKYFQDMAIVFMIMGFPVLIFSLFGEYVGNILMQKIITSLPALTYNILIFTVNLPALAVYLLSIAIGALVGLLIGLNALSYYTQSHISKNL